MIPKSNQNFNRLESPLFDPSNRFSLARMMPEPFGQHIKLLTESEDRYLLALDEFELIKELTRKGFSPGIRDFTLRENFWLEYTARAKKVSTYQIMMNLPRVLRRTMPKELFWNGYITDHRRLSWLLCPPIDVKQMLRTASALAIQIVVEVLKSGKPNGVGRLTYLKEVAKILNQLTDNAHVLEHGCKPERRGGSFKKVRNEEPPPLVEEDDPVAALAKELDGQT